MDEEVWEVLRRGETPEELILDPETGLEGFLSGCGCLQIFFGIVLLADAFQELGWLPASLVVLGILFFILRSKLDDHYVLDFAKRQLLFNRTFWGKASRRVICSFDELVALVVEPERNTSKSSVWWEYGLTLVRRNGQTVKVVSPDEQDYDKVVRHGRQVAELMKLDFHEAQPEMLLKLGPGPTIAYEPFNQAKVAALVVAVVGLVVLAIVIIMTVTA